MVRRARADHGAGGAAARIDDAAGVAHRAGRIWPEYSEMQCYACHHSLTPPEQSWRQARGLRGRRPGDPPWNASRYAVFRDVVHQLDGAGCRTAGRPDFAADEADEPAESRSRRSGKRGNTIPRDLADALVAKMQAAAYDPASTLRLLQKDFRRRGRHFRPGRAIRGAGGHGDPVAFRRVRPRREIAELRGDCAPRSARCFSSSRIHRPTIRRDSRVRCSR